MNHTVATGEFEGPLGVLLELVERNKLEVSAISVGAITKRYLETIEARATDKPEDLSEFVQLGARLLYIKSLALLPQTNPAEQAEELARLNIELAEYKAFQVAAKHLAGRGSLRSWPRAVKPKLSAAEQPMPELSLAQLADAFKRALALAPVAPEPRLIKSHLSLETVTKRLKTRLTTGFDLHTVIESCRDRLEIVVTFLALLELVRDGSAHVTQAGQFDPIRVEASHVS